MVLIYLCAAITLYVLRHETKLANARPSEADRSAGKERMTARSVAEVRAVTISLEDYSLTVMRRKFQSWKWMSQNLPILKPVTAKFDPGTLNVIM
jgi:hypothetical protein